MATESEDDYVQRRFRETPPKSDVWTAPDVWTRPPQMEGLNGGRDSYSLPVRPSPEPIVNGAPSVGTSGGTKRVIITDPPGVPNYYDITATYVGPV